MQLRIPGSLVSPWGADRVSTVTDTDRESRLLASLPSGLFIGGEWQPASSGVVFGVEDPSTGDKLIPEVADGGAVDAIGALDAASDAQSAWACTAPRTRSEILRRAYELILERADRFALLMTLEMGKPIADSMGEVRYGAEFFRWFSEEAVRINGRYTVAPGGDGHLMVTSRPVGPSLFITPWNFPLAMATRKIGPAIAAGCTMILKPAALTPFTAIALAEVLVDAGLPDGVMNLVTSTQAGDVGEALLGDARLRKLSFTGSTKVGRGLRALASPNLQRVSMELGGNAPFLVFDDADVEAAVDGAFVAKMRNMGEACTSANRFVVHESVADEFTAKLADRMGQLHLGRGTEPGVEVGPLIEERARAKVSDLVDDAVAQGAQVVTGAVKPDRPGWFYEPTVLADVASTSRVLHEEIFGPVAPIVTFSDDDEGIAVANDTEYGLVAYVYTRGLDRALRVADELDSGMVGINRGVVSNPAAPFGGVKQSGLGREGGAEGVWEYLDVKYVGIAES